MDTTSTQLERRLRTGERLIEAETDPNRRMQLEDHWIDLLHRYEVAVDSERQLEDRRTA